MTQPTTSSAISVTPVNVPRTDPLFDLCGFDRPLVFSHTEQPTQLNRVNYREVVFTEAQKSKDDKLSSVSLFFEKIDDSSFTLRAIFITTRTNCKYSYRTPEYEKHFPDDKGGYGGGVLGLSGLSAMVVRYTHEQSISHNFQKDPFKFLKTKIGEHEKASMWLVLKCIFDIK